MILMRDRGNSLISDFGFSRNVLTLIAVFHLYYELYRMLKKIITG